MTTKPVATPIVVPPEFQELATQIGQFIEYWGFKRIHGEIWAHVYLSHDPIDATTLAKRLNVSKALVSLAIKDLVEYKVIEVCGAGPRRKVLLSANNDIIGVISSVLRMRERKMLASINSSFRNLKKLSEEDKKRINMDAIKTENLGDMIEMAESTLDMLISSDLMLDTALPHEP